MRTNWEHLERFRIRVGEYATKCGEKYGAFIIPNGRGSELLVIAIDGSDWDECGLAGQPWEHVSVSLPSRCPTWNEMCEVKHLFFENDEIVVQFHPAKSDYVNHHNYCLHLWRPVAGWPIMPPMECV